MSITCTVFSEEKKRIHTYPVVSERKQNPLRNGMITNIFSLIRQWRYSVQRPEVRGLQSFMCIVDKKIAIRHLVWNSVDALTVIQNIIDKIDEIVLPIKQRHRELELKTKTIPLYLCKKKSLCRYTCITHMRTLLILNRITREVLEVTKISLWMMFSSED